MSLLPVGIGSEEGGYRIERSLRFNSADSAFLNRTPASAGDLQKWTWSAWVKRGNSSNSIFSTNASNNLSYNYFGFSSDSFRLYQWNGSGYDFQLITTAVYRDQSAWYHFVISVDTTQATAGNRVKFYVNGVQVTSFSTNTTPSQNLNTYVNSNSYSHLLGRNPGGSSTYLDGYLTEVNFIDGQALTPTSFGEFNTDTGVWQPKKYTGTYGTNGFYLDFADNSGTTSTTLGKDSSGNGNNWTPNNFSVTAGAGNDSLVDSPTRYGTDTGAGGEVRGNYATLNPLSNLGSTFTFTNGNLDCLLSSGDKAVPSTMLVSSGKWYCEMTITAVGTGGSSVGIIPAIYTASAQIGNTATSYAYRSSGNKRTNNSDSAYGASYTTNDVIGIALDLDAGTLVFYKNGSSQGTAFSSISGEYAFAFSSTSSGSTTSVTFNAGQRPFAYTAPSGFKALVTTNLPAPTIADGGEYFNTVLYTGNGSTQSVTGVGFQPDFVWIKSRSGVTWNNLYDSVRGVNKALYSNDTFQEFTDTNLLTSFNSNGFSIGDSTVLNTNAATLVAWNWKANGAGVTNTAGTITSTVSANTDSGFSIVTYTGTGAASGTIGHGLSAVPSMIITKKRSSGGTDYGWSTYHKSIGSNNIWLDKTNAQNPGNWPTPPTTTVFTHAVLDYNNVSGETYVNYVFAEIAGYSAFGSYTGNGSADGPFVYTGFRPRWVMIKPTSTTGSWQILDTSRDPYNVEGNLLWANESTAELSSPPRLDGLSNGFKVRASSGSHPNVSGVTYIYMAFAENPFAYSLAR
jgi:hypothetical protein